MKDNALVFADYGCESPESSVVRYLESKLRPSLTMRVVGLSSDRVRELTSSFRHGTTMTDVPQTERPDPPCSPQQWMESVEAVLKTSRGIWLDPDKIVEMLPFRSTPSVVGKVLRKMMISGMRVRFREIKDRRKQWQLF